MDVLVGLLFQTLADRWTVGFGNGGMMRRATVSGVSPDHGSHSVSKVTERLMVNSCGPSDLLLYPSRQLDGVGFEGSWAPIHASHWSGGGCLVPSTVNGKVNGHVNRDSMIGIHGMVVVRDVMYPFVVGMMVVVVVTHRNSVDQPKAVRNDVLVVENALGTHLPNDQVRCSGDTVVVRTLAFDHHQNWRMVRLQQ